MGKIRLHLLCVASAAFLSPLVARAAVPIALTPGSFNQDAVVEATAVNDATTHYSTNVTATMDGGTAKNGGEMQRSRRTANVSESCPFFPSRAETTCLNATHEACRIILSML